MHLKSVICLLLLACSITSRADTLVLTSFPERFYSHLLHAYKQQDPDAQIRFLNKKTPALIAHLSQQRKPYPDLVWVSSPDAMALMKNMDLIDDPVTFAWSQFGFFWHNATIDQQSLQPPTHWYDLLDERYMGHVALSAPSRSGTNHLVVELLLQQYGWDEGWRVIAQLSGNLATITARSFGVREGILKQRFAVAPVVDFFYKNAIEQGYPVGFVPFPSAPLIPAQIARVRNGANGQRFVDFLLDEEGQKVISASQLNRISLQQAEVQQSSANSYDFSTELSASRYYLVNSLFDVFVTERLGSLQEFWVLWHQVNKATLSEHDRRLMEQAYQLATQVPVDESVASDPTLNRSLSPNLKYEHGYQRITSSWQQSLSQSLELAKKKLATLSEQGD